MWAFLLKLAMQIMHLHPSVVYNYSFGNSIARGRVQRPPRDPVLLQISHPCRIRIRQWDEGGRGGVLETEVVAEHRGTAGDATRRWGRRRVANRCFNADGGGGAPNLGFGVACGRWPVGSRSAQGRQLDWRREVGRRGGGDTASAVVDQRAGPEWWSCGGWRGAAGGGEG
jgi:hypothetical protein